MLIEGLFDIPPPSVRISVLPLPLWRRLRALPPLLTSAPEAVAVLTSLETYWMDLKSHTSRVQLDLWIMKSSIFRSQFYSFRLFPSYPLANLFLN